MCVWLFFKLIYLLLKDDCFTEFCCFLSNLSMNQPQVYVYSFPFEPPSHLPPHPTPTGWYGEPVWVPWDKEQIPFGCLFYIRETVSDFIFWGSKTADGDCSHEIKRCLLLGRKVMTNLDNILKSRDITLPTNVHLVKAMVFSVVMYGCESWTVKKAECRRIDAFELWCWRRLFFFFFFFCCI